MLSYQSLNQILLNVSQTTLSLPARPTRVSAVSKITFPNVICSESFLETVRVLKKSNNAALFEHLPDTKLCPTIKNGLCYDATEAKNVNELEVVTKLTENILEKSLFNKNPWKISYTSGDTFEQNKRTTNIISCRKIHSNKILFEYHSSPMLSIAINKIQYPILGVQIRGFKTHRRLIREGELNPGLLEKLIGAFSSKSTSKSDSFNQLSSSQRSELESVLKSADKKMTPEALKKLLEPSGEATSRGRSGFSFLNSLAVVSSLLWIIVGLVCLYGIAGISALGLKMRVLGNSEIRPEDIKVSFDDVKGATEAKQELMEVVEYLRNPEKFSSLGGKLPKGVLLVGPPGTGKTLLARAVAGEAKVPFFHASGSEFDEIFVGQGAKRVRELFTVAKARAPCIIFIDEIDSVGGKRSSSALHPYANQTINQLLSEMDGFQQNEGVIVMGATNRKKALDNALLRSGRFDIEIAVPKPSLNDRKEILELYLSKIESQDVDVNVLARGTRGFTGADIQTVVNQAAIKAAMDGADFVVSEHLEAARDRILMGPERKSLVRTEEDDWITAYHEGGHAVVMFFTKESDPVHKVTIVPRANSLGHTGYLPSESLTKTKSRYLASLDAKMGGRAAEELIFGPDKVTSGCSNDLETATLLATEMVKSLGMSDKAGLRTYSSSGNFNKYGQTASDQIDNEIKKILQESYERAKHILKTHSHELQALAEALMKYETLDADDVKTLLSGKNLGDKK